MPDVNNQDDWVDDLAMADAGLFQDEGFTNEQVLKAISLLLPKQYAFFIPSQFELISFFSGARKATYGAIR